MDALLAQRRLLAPQLRVAHALDQDVDAALVRHVLDRDAAGGGRRVGVVREHVAAADLDGIEPQRPRREVDQVLADRVADRVADGAILRGRRLVLENDGGARPVVLVAVRPARDVEDLGALEHAGARILRIGARARQHVDVERQYLARLADGHARLDRGLARVDVGDERLDAVGDELDGTAELDRRRHGRDLVAVAVDLEPERAADVGRHDLHHVVRHAQRARVEILDHVRALAAGVDGELARALVEGRQHAARLEAHSRMAAELEGVLDDEVGACEGRLGVAVVDDLAVGEVVAELGVDRGRAGIERPLLVGDRRQLLPLDGDALGCVLGLGARRRHHQHHRLAHPAGAVHGHRILRAPTSCRESR